MEMLEIENAMLKREIKHKDEMIKKLLDKLSPDVEKNSGQRKECVIIDFDSKKVVK